MVLLVTPVNLIKRNGAADSKLVALVVLHWSSICCFTSMAIVNTNAYSTWSNSVEA